LIPFAAFEKDITRARGRRVYAGKDGLSYAAARRHKVSTVKPVRSLPTTNNITQRERETARSKFNSRFIRRFGVCSGLQCRRRAGGDAAQLNAKGGRAYDKTHTLQMGLGWRRARATLRTTW
jgi:hypothetical protein